MECVGKILPEQMVERINYFYLNEMEQLQKQLWEHRRICILQVLKIILTKIFLEKKMKECEFVCILESAEKNLDDKYFSSKSTPLEVSEDNKLENLTDLDLDVNSMTKSLFTLVTKFVDNIEQYVDNNYILKIKPVLISVITIVESEIHKLFKYETKVLVNIYNELIVTLQTINSKNSGQFEILFSYSNFIEANMKKLLDSNKLSKEVGGRLNQNVREKFEGVWEDLDSDINKIGAKHLHNIYSKNNSELNQLVELKNQTLQKLLDNSDSSSLEDFIKRYFSIVIQFRAQELTKIFENTKYTNSEIQKLQQESKFSMLMNCEKIKSEFCAYLVLNKSLNDYNANEISQQLVFKIKKASEDVSVIEKVQTKLIENEINTRLSLKKYSDSSEHFKENILLGKVKADELKTIQKILAEQIDFTNSDCSFIFNEYNAVLQVFLNNISLSEAIDYHNLDSIVIPKQLKILTLAREEKRLQNEDNICLIQKGMVEIRNNILQQNEETCEQTSLENFIKTENLRKEIVYESIASKLLDYRYPNLKTKNQQLRIFASIKDLIYAKVIENGKLYNKELKQLYNDYIAQSNFIAKEHIQTRDIGRQVIKDLLMSHHQPEFADVQNKNTKQTKSAATKNTDIMNVKLQRKVDEIRSRKSEEKLKVKEKTENVFDYAILCKITLIGKLTKSQMLHSVKEGLEVANIEENSKKKIMSEFSRVWVKVNGEFHKPKKVTPLKEGHPAKPAKGKRGNLLNRLARQKLESNSSSSTSSEET